MGRDRQAGFTLFELLFVMTAALGAGALFVLIYVICHLISKVW